jgi:hypothetical protein
VDEHDRNRGDDLRASAVLLVLGSSAYPFPGSWLEGSAAASAGDRLPDQQEDNRADDRRDPGAEKEELVDRVAEPERLCDEASEEGADDADDRR